ncbi:MAG: hypothetical protein ABSC25_27830 [Roseiarcus sp.]|jgi:NAD(P)-dependent dehydrogenase (short-subunit alcohol dehydrogenase family)
MLDSNRLEGKTALVTGGGGEVGAAAICLMAARGARRLRGALMGMRS